MPILISEARSRAALALGLAIIGEQEAIEAKETAEQRLGDELEKAYRLIAASPACDEFAKTSADFTRWLAMQNKT
jgi:hypothetical protein